MRDRIGRAWRVLAVDFTATISGAHAAETESVGSSTTLRRPDSAPPNLSVMNSNSFGDGDGEVLRLGLVELNYIGTWTLGTPGAEMGSKKSCLVDDGSGEAGPGPVEGKLGPDVGQRLLAGEAGADHALAGGDRDVDPAWGSGLVNRPGMEAWGTSVRDRAGR